MSNAAQNIVQLVSIIQLSYYYKLFHRPLANTDLRMIVLLTARIHNLLLECYTLSTLQ
jgi:hypothetical protein